MSSSPSSMRKLGHLATIAPSRVRSRDFSVFSSDAGQDFSPQVGSSRSSVALDCRRCIGRLVFQAILAASRVPQNKILADGGSVPNAFGDFTTQLTSNPRSVAFDEQSAFRIKPIDPNFVHEFLVASNKDAGAQLLRSFDVAESVQDRVFLGGNRAAIGDWGSWKSQLEA